MKIVCLLGLMIAALTATVLQPTRAEAAATLDFNAAFTYDGAQMSGQVTFSDDTYTDIVGVNLQETETVNGSPVAYTFTVVGTGNANGEIGNTGEYNWELFNAANNNLVLDIAWTVPSGQLPMIDFDGSGVHNVTDTWSNPMVEGEGSFSNGSPVPVPASLLLLGPGLAGLATVRRRFKK